MAHPNNTTSGSAPIKPIIPSVPRMASFEDVRQVIGQVIGQLQAQLIAQLPVTNYQGRRITNVAVPIGADDVVTLKYLQGVESTPNQRAPGRNTDILNAKELHVKTPTADIDIDSGTSGIEIDTSNHGDDSIGVHVEGFAAESFLTANGLQVGNIIGPDTIIAEVSPDGVRVYDNDEDLVAALTPAGECGVADPGGSAGAVLLQANYSGSGFGAVLINGTRVLGPQQSFIADVTGTTDIDLESKINEVIAALKAIGILASS